jgi:hypothetical protein
MTAAEIQMHPGDLTQLKREVMEAVYEQEGNHEHDARLEMMIKVDIILDGIESCTVGFLPHHVASRPQEAAQFAQTYELYAVI